MERGRFFPVHQKASLNQLRQEWASFKLMFCDGLWQPINLVRDYFGAEIAMYFAYLALYSWWLLWPAIIGAGVFAYQTVIADHDARGAILGYACLMILWSTVFLERWKREQISLANEWGTLGVEQQERDRPEFIEMSTEVRNKFTNEVDYEYHSGKKWSGYLLTWVLPLFLILIALCGIVGIFMLRYWLEVEHGLGVLAGVANGVCINGFNEAYKELALCLTNMEPHRTDTMFRDALIAKVFLFQFINSYFPLYLVAFIKSNAVPLGVDRWIGECKCTQFSLLSGGISYGYTNSDQCIESDLHTDPQRCECDTPDCVYELAYLLLSIFGVQLVIGNVLEFVVPWFQAKLEIWGEEKMMDPRFAGKELTVAEAEAKLHYYERLEIFNDYNEMILQLGYITLFSPVFPIVALMGLVNNLVELRSDSNKLCQVYQRPLAIAVEDIGTWETIIEIMTFISVATNCALVWFVTDFGKQYPMKTQIWGFVISEHVFLLIKVWVAWAIPDVPEAVQQRIEAQDKLTTRALKQELVDEYHPDQDPFFRCGHLCAKQLISCVFQAGLAR